MNIRSTGPSQLQIEGYSCTFNDPYNYLGEQIPLELSIPSSEVPYSIVQAILNEESSLLAKIYRDIFGKSSASTEEEEGDIVPLSPEAGLSSSTIFIDPRRYHEWRETMRPQLKTIGFTLEDREMFIANCSADVSCIAQEMSLIQGYLTHPHGISRQNTPVHIPSSRCAPRGAAGVSTNETTTTSTYTTSTRSTGGFDSPFFYLDGEVTNLLSISADALHPLTIDDATLESIKKAPNPGAMLHAALQASLTWHQKSQLLDVTDSPQPIAIEGNLGQSLCQIAALYIIVAGSIQDSCGMRKQFVLDFIETEDQSRALPGLTFFERLPTGSMNQVFCYVGDALSSSHIGNNPIQAKECWESLDSYQKQILLLYLIQPLTQISQTFHPVLAKAAKSCLNQLQGIGQVLLHRSRDLYFHSLNQNVFLTCCQIDEALLNVNSRYEKGAIATTPHLFFLQALQCHFSELWEAKGIVDDDTKLNHYEKEESALAICLLAAYGILKEAVYKKTSDWHQLWLNPFISAYYPNKNYYIDQTGTCQGIFPYDSVLSGFWEREQEWIDKGRIENVPLLSRDLNLIENQKLFEEYINWRLQCQWQPGSVVDHPFLRQIEDATIEDATIAHFQAFYERLQSVARLLYKRYFCSMWAEIIREVIPNEQPSNTTTLFVASAEGQPEVNINHLGKLPDEALAVGLQDLGDFHSPKSAALPRLTEAEKKKPPSSNEIFSRLFHTAKDYNHAVGGGNCCVLALAQALWGDARGEFTDSMIDKLTDLIQKLRGVVAKTIRSNTKIFYSEVDINPWWFSGVISNFLSSPHLFPLFLQSTLKRMVPNFSDRAHSLFLESLCFDKISYQIQDSEIIKYKFKSSVWSAMDEEGKNAWILEKARNIEKNSDWFDQAELEVVSKIIQRPICIFPLNRGLPALKNNADLDDFIKETICPEYGVSAAPIYLSTSGVHYAYLVPKRNGTQILA